MGTYCIMLLLSFSLPFYSSKAVFHDRHWQRKCLCIELSLFTSPFVCFNFMILFLTDVQRPIPDAIRSGGICVLPDVWKREAETCGGPGAAGHHRAVLQGWTHRKVRLATVAGVAVEFEFSVALCPQSTYKLLGTGSPGRPPPLSQLPSSDRSSSVLLDVHRDHTDNTFGLGSPGRPPPLSQAPDLWQVKFSVAWRPQRPYRQYIWVGEPRTATSTFTSSWPLTGQVQCCLTSTETIQTIHLGWGAQDGHLHFHKLLTSEAVEHT